MAARRKPSDEVDPRSGPVDGDPDTGADTVRGAEAEPDFDSVEVALDALDGGGDEGDISADDSGDGPDAGGNAGTDGEPVEPQYTAEDAGYGEFRPDPDERQPGAPPHQFTHYHEVSTAGFTDRGADLYTKSVGYQWPKPGQPVELDDDDYFTGVGDSYPLLPALQSNPGI